MVFTSSNGGTSFTFRWSKRAPMSATIRCRSAKSTTMPIRFSSLARAWTRMRQLWP